jgi:hypothetical protein
MKSNLPQSIVFFYNRREPELEDIIKVVRESKIPNTSLLPTTGCSTIYFMYGDNHYLSGYGPDEIKEAVKVLI